MYLLSGIIAFIFFIFFDLNKIYFKSKLLNLLFVIGAVLLIFSTAVPIVQSDYQALIYDFKITNVFFLIAAIISGAALIYVLFFALPFENTYVQSSKLPLVNKGVYTSCRHPGFWPFVFFYLFLALLFSSNQLFWCFIVFSICNFLYIVIQDKFIFPKYIEGYLQYKKTVPFLIPTKESIKNAFKR